MRQIMKEELATGKLRDRLLVAPSVPSPQMALFDPSPILALPPIPDLLPATLLLPSFANTGSSAGNVFPTA